MFMWLQVYIIYSFEDIYRLMNRNSNRNRLTVTPWNFGKNECKWKHFADNVIVDLNLSSFRKMYYFKVELPWKYWELSQGIEGNSTVQILLPEENDIRQLDHHCMQIS
jgi:hypothetical protein